MFTEGLSMTNIKPLKYLNHICMDLITNKNNSAPSFFRNLVKKEREEIWRNCEMWDITVEIDVMLQV